MRKNPAGNGATRRRALALILAGAATFGWALQAVAEDAGFTKITSAELAEMLAHKDFFFVNVHIPYEGEIVGTDAFIPFDQIAAYLDELPKDKAAPIVLYCRSGRMSDIAAKQLVSLGYTKVYDHLGGMIDWKNTGHEVIEK